MGGVGKDMKFAAAARVPQRVVQPLGVDGGHDRIVAGIDDEGRRRIGQQLGVGLQRIIERLLFHRRQRRLVPHDGAALGIGGNRSARNMFYG